MKPWYCIGILCLCLLTGCRSCPSDYTSSGTTTPLPPTAVSTTDSTTANDKATTSYTTPITTTSSTTEVQIQAPVLCQFPDYPTGCEAVTAVMALQHSGLSVTVDEFIDHHLPCDSGFYYRQGRLHGPDPYRVFVGNPRTAQSYGAMAPPLEQALRTCVAGRRQVTNTTGLSLPELCRTYIDRGIPVMVWATMDMSPIRRGRSWQLPDGQWFVWPAGEHCLLLVGYDNAHYYFNDPRRGYTVGYDKALSAERYTDMGRQSLVIE